VREWAKDRTYPFRVFLRQHLVHELDSFDSVAEDHYSALATLLVVDVRLVDAVEPFEQLANLLVLCQSEQSAVFAVSGVRAHTISEQF
jgi:hypothetical protein